MKWKRHPHLHRLGDRITLYLPVFIMGLLALGSYWVWRSNPLPAELAAPGSARHEADYFMRDFSVHTHTAEGHLRNQLSGTEAKHYPDTNTLEIEQAQVQTQRPNGEILHSTARHLLADTQQELYWLTGQVRVEKFASGQSTARMRFQGEQLHIDGAHDLISSEQPIVLIYNDNKANANSLQYDGSTGIALLKGQVKVRFPARTEP